MSLRFIGVSGCAALALFLSFNACAALEPGISDRYKPAKPPLEAVQEQLVNGNAAGYRHKRYRLKRIVRNLRRDYYDGRGVWRRLEYDGRRRAVNLGREFDPRIGDMLNHILTRHGINADDIIDIMLR